jgi:hypothetical protein
MRRHAAKSPRLAARNGRFRDLEPTVRDRAIAASRLVWSGGLAMAAGEIAGSPRPAPLAVRDDRATADRHAGFLGAVNIAFGSDIAAADRRSQLAA